MPKDGTYKLGGEKGMDLTALQMSILGQSHLKESSIMEDMSAKQSQDGNASSDQLNEKDVTNLEQMVNNQAELDKMKTLLTFHGAKFRAGKASQVYAGVVPVFPGATLDLSNAAMQSKGWFRKTITGEGGKLVLAPAGAASGITVPVENLKVSKSEFHAEAPLSNQVGFRGVDKILKGSKIILTEDSAIIEGARSVYLDYKGQETPNVEQVGDVQVDGFGFQSPVNREYSANTVAAAEAEEARKKVEAKARAEAVVKAKAEAEAKAKAKAEAEAKAKAEAEAKAKAKAEAEAQKNAEISSGAGQDENAIEDEPLISSEADENNKLLFFVEKSGSLLDSGENSEEQEVEESSDEEKSEKENSFESKIQQILHPNEEKEKDGEEGEKSEEKNGDEKQEELSDAQKSAAQNQALATGEDVVSLFEERLDEKLTVPLDPSGLLNLELGVGMGADLDYRLAAKGEQGLKEQNDQITLIGAGDLKGGMVTNFSVGLSAGFLGIAKLKGGLNTTGTLTGDAQRALGRGEVTAKLVRDGKGTTGFSVREITVKADMNLRLKAFLGAELGLKILGWEKELFSTNLGNWDIADITGKLELTKSFAAGGGATDGLYIKNNQGAINAFGKTYLMGKLKSTDLKKFQEHEDSDSVKAFNAANDAFQQTIELAKAWEAAKTGNAILLTSTDQMSRFKGSMDQKKELYEELNGKLLEQKNAMREQEKRLLELKKDKSYLAYEKKIREYQKKHQARLDVIDSAIKEGKTGKELYQDYQNTGAGRIFWSNGFEKYMTEKFQVNDLKKQEKKRRKELNADTVAQKAGRLYKYVDEVMQGKKESKNNTEFTPLDVAIVMKQPDQLLFYEKSRIQELTKDSRENQENIRKKAEKKGVDLNKPDHGITLSYWRHLTKLKELKEYLINHAGADKLIEYETIKAEAENMNAKDVKDGLITGKMGSKDLADYADIESKYTELMSLKAQIAKFNQNKTPNEEQKKKGQDAIIRHTELNNYLNNRTAELYNLNGGKDNLHRYASNAQYAKFLEAQAKAEEDEAQKSDDSTKNSMRAQKLRSKLTVQMLEAYETSLGDKQHKDRMSILREYLDKNPETVTREMEERTIDLYFYSKKGKTTEEKLKKRKEKNKIYSEDYINYYMSREDLPEEERKELENPYVSELRKEIAILNENPDGNVYESIHKYGVGGELESNTMKLSGRIHDFEEFLDKNEKGLGIRVEDQMRYYEYLFQKNAGKLEKDDVNHQQLQKSLVQMKEQGKTYDEILEEYSKQGDTEKFGRWILLNDSINPWITPQMLLDFEDETQASATEKHRSRQEKLQNAISNGMTNTEQYDLTTNYFKEARNGSIQGKGKLERETLNDFKGIKAEDFQVNINNYAEYLLEKEQKENENAYEFLSNDSLSDQEKLSGYTGKFAVSKLFSMENAQQEKNFSKLLEHYERKRKKYYKNLYKEWQKPQKEIQSKIEQIVVQMSTCESIMKYVNDVNAKGNNLEAILANHDEMLKIFNLDKNQNVESDLADYKKTTEETKKIEKFSMENLDEELEPEKGNET